MGGGWDPEHSMAFPTVEIESDLNFGWQPHHKRDGWLLIWHARVHWSTLRFSPYMNISHNLWVAHYELCIYTYIYICIHIWNKGLAWMFNPPRLVSECFGRKTETLSSNHSLWSLTFFLIRLVSCWSAGLWAISRFRWPRSVRELINSETSTRPPPRIYRLLLRFYPVFRYFQCRSLFLGTVKPCRCWCLRF